MMTSHLNLWHHSSLVATKTVSRKIKLDINCRELNYPTNVPQTAAKERTLTKWTHTKGVFQVVLGHGRKFRMQMSPAPHLRPWRDAPGLASQAGRRVPW